MTDHADKQWLRRSLHERLSGWLYDHCDSIFAVVVWFLVVMLIFWNAGRME
jgi:hypothetical protein